MDWISLFSSAGHMPSWHFVVNLDVLVPVDGAFDLEFEAVTGSDFGFRLDYYNHPDRFPCPHGSFRDHGPPWRLPGSRRRLLLGHLPGLRWKELELRER